MTLFNLIIMTFGKKKKKKSQFHRAPIYNITKNNVDTNNKK